MMVRTAPPDDKRFAAHVFEPEPGQVMAARRFVVTSLELWGLPAGDVPLLVSELATNAVLHARSDFEVSVSCLSDRIRVEVFDRNTRLPAFTVVPADAYSGRGLMLVQALSSAWGVEAHSDNGKTIWFEVSLEGLRVQRSEGSLRNVRERHTK